jgi:hypothetical protein
MFDASELPADITLIQWVFYLWGNGKSDFLGIEPDMNIYDVTTVNETSLVPADYNTFGTTAYCDLPITYNNWQVENWNTFISNSAGLAGLQTAYDASGIFKIGGRNANYDVAEVAPTWVSNKNSDLDCYFADDTDVPGSSPKLVVTYAEAMTNVKATNVKQIVLLEAVRNVEMSAMGRFYVDEQGNAKYESRFARN